MVLHLSVGPHDPAGWAELEVDRNWPRIAFLSMEALLDRPIFNIPQKFTDRFVTGKFAKRVSDGELGGFDLQPCEVH